MSALAAKSPNDSKIARQQHLYTLERPLQQTAKDAVENAAKKAADNPFKTIHKLYAVEQRNQATPSNSETKLNTLEQRNQDYTPSNNEKTWPPPPREARGPDHRCRDRQD